MRKFIILLACSIAWLYCNDPDLDYVESEAFITEFFF